MTSPAPENLSRAIDLWREAYQEQMKGDLERAITLYQESIRTCPTAEAHTFLGWTYSFQGRLDDATEECHRAIEIDPDFGNPYNDIGAYLIQLGRIEDAIPWLERAKRAVRYEPRHYPHINLSQIHVMRNDINAAVRELRAAVALEPEHESARRELHRLLGMLN
jgi:Tfp pilus assembly protein PilF